MFGIFFVQATTNFLLDPANEEYKAPLLQFWGSVIQSILSLFIASLGGMDWVEIADTLKPVGMVYFYLFLVYIGFFFTVVTNTLTSLFVESAMYASDKDQSALMEEELQQKDRYIDELTGFYTGLDTTGTGKVALEGFMSQVDNPEMVKFAMDMEISIIELKQFFTVLSANGRRKVDLESFIVGCIKLRGQAKSMDLWGLYYEHRETAQDLGRLLEICNKEFTRLDGMIQAVARTSPASRPDGRLNAYDDDDALVI